MYNGGGLLWYLAVAGLVIVLYLALRDYAGVF